ncbi:ABC transporter permease subunit [Gemmata sp. JC717]|uniref:ABC transporter permease subunit n=1 Tax=Gemmata algarum TaxID=2975278 RepID=A0ABU5F7Y6_9BACT|nr:ABC transporter permease [Gemmata algarum]MDY3553168.1 ABC transporter permease subunit [Gemmata algarum]MDY3562830.1 ABC transporter permease subunit [Gemmata algarum]
MFSTWINDPTVLLAGVVLAAVQFVAALPWLWAIDPKGFKAASSSPMAFLYVLLGLLVAGVGIATFLGYKGDATVLAWNGRYIYGAVLHLQLIFAVFLLLPQVLIMVWPKGGVVAFAAFRESCRQPMFWLITGAAAIAIWISITIPYFTFGDDYKMMKQIGFDIVMLSATLFGVLAASMSISEEIEGRTAVTLMSKPVNRRQFLLGKFFGILMACLVMSLLLSWTLTDALRAMREFDPINNTADPADPLGTAEKVVDPLTFQAQRTVVPPFRAAVPSALGKAVATGAGLRFSDALAHSFGVALGFGQVMILVAVASALATRVTFVVNLVLCLMLYFLGHLAPVVVQVTQQAQGGGVGVRLIGFLGQLFDALLPSLESFNMGRAIIRESPLDLWQFGVYVLTVTGYSLIYTVIALLGGLLLFEDRDLA